ncbi:MAG: hypothetical protein JXP34_18440 [Planctomycetes bacterium]|nr:hypothetical protein [Planctomycetota bacterium]
MRTILARALAIIALAGPAATAFGAPLDPDHLKFIPVEKDLDPAWVRSLTARGEPAILRGSASRFVGMPIGGICSGTLYLGGDGTLWLWEIFNQSGRGGIAGRGTSGQLYVNPLEPFSPLACGFAIRTEVEGRVEERRLDRAGFSEISFLGEYPIARVEYRQPGSPIEVDLTAFSPFVPLDYRASSHPATVLRYTVRNAGGKPAACVIAGWLENAIGLVTGGPGKIVRRNAIVATPDLLVLDLSAEQPPAPSGSASRPDILFDDFEAEAYQGWTAEGTAFGAGPIERSKIPAYQTITKLHGDRMVNSHSTAPGASIGEKDGKTGTLTSRPFRIERNFINFLIGGGAHEDRTCMQLLVEGKVVAAATGRNNNEVHADHFDVGALQGKEARFRIVDAESGGWGNIGVDFIVFGDAPSGESYDFAKQHDFGTMALALAGAGAAGRASPASQEVGDFASLGPIDGRGAPAPKEAPFGKKHIGAVGRAFALEPGAEHAATFIVAWRFPNLYLPALAGNLGREQATRFPSARAVAEDVARNLDRLADLTALWHRTWYEDSTLPRWFLNRTLVNASILATETCYRFADGRFYGWEGIGCCAGTCGHVWQYAQAPARLFPELERDLRERVDFGIAMNPDGGVRFRGECNAAVAIDGQAGVVLRSYREHLMTADGAFLRRNWESIEKALGYLIRRDGNGDGIIEGAQHNTLDADWYGKIPAMSSLYLAALAAGRAMAEEVGDEAFAEETARILARGRKSILELFDGEYFIQQEDPAHADVIGVGTGCHIDNVFGQSWAFQVGLGRLYDAGAIRAALRSLWRYNFILDIGPLRASLPERIRGRPYALAGDAGLLMCTWPHGGKRADWAKHWQYMYFNECMTGFEYQVAGHMLWEGMIEEGLAIARAIHDRYGPEKRNPYNEIECSDHYARAMASYGVFLAACGFEYDGPAGHIGFAPRLGPEDFRAAFTAAEGWGSIAQRREGSVQRASIEVRHGRVRIATVSLAPLSGIDATRIRTKRVSRGRGEAIRCRGSLRDGRILVTLEAPVLVEERGSLEIDLGE